MDWQKPQKRNGGNTHHCWFLTHCPIHRRSMICQLVSFHTQSLPLCCRHLTDQLLKEALTVDGGRCCVLMKALQGPTCHAEQLKEELPPTPEVNIPLFRS